MSTSTPITETIGQMTRDELTRFVDERVQIRYITSRYGAEIIDGRLFFSYPSDGRTLEDVFASIDANMWTPPPGAPTTQELLRQERDA